MDLPGIYAPSRTAMTNARRSTTSHTRTRPVINITDSQLRAESFNDAVDGNGTSDGDRAEHDGHAVHRGIHIDEHLLSERLGIPVLSVSAVSPKSCETFLLDLHEHLHLEHAAPRPSGTRTPSKKLLRNHPEAFKDRRSDARPERWVAIQYPKEAPLS